MKSICILLASITVSWCAFSQTPGFEWIHKFGDSNDEQVNCSTLDKYGNSFFGGQFRNTIDVNPGAGSLIYTNSGYSFMDGYIQKMNPNGQLLWALQISGTGFIDAMCTDTLGNLYVAGSYNDNFIKIGAIEYSSSMKGVFVAKISPDGVVQSLINNPVSGSGYARVREMDVTNNGQVYVTGYFYGTLNGVSSTTGVPDIFVLVNNTVNNSVSATRFFGGANGDYVSDIKTDGTYYYLVGSYSGTGTFNGNGAYNQTSLGGSDVFFIKYLASNHSISFANFLRGTGDEFISSLDLDNSGNIYLMGQFLTNSDINPASGTVNPATNGQLIIKFSTTGTYISHTSLTTYLSGSSSSDRKGLHFNKYDNHLYSAYETSQTASNLVFGISKHDVNLNQIWQSSLKTGADMDFDIQVDPYQNIYMSGTIPDIIAVDVDPSAVVNNIYSNGLDDLFHLKWGQCQSSSSSINVSSCNTYTAPDGQQYSVAGQYIALVSNSIGCDSIISINLSIQDIAAPVPNVPSLPEISENCSVSSITIPTATDVCSGLITGTFDATLPITTNSTITWTYDDGNGNISTQTQNVVINDAVAPVADAVNLSDVVSECSVTSLITPSATDNCIGTITGTHDATLPITAQGTTVVTWTYNDGNGNISIQTQNVIIDDVTAPVPNIASLTNVNAECSVTNLAAPTATDNCAGMITGTHNVSLPITVQGTTVVTWTYDDGNGNISTQTQNVVVDDVTAPVPTNASLSNVNAECSVTSLTAPTATDNCAGTITGTHNATLPIASQGTTVVTWTYDDGNGNTFTQTQNVVINDVSVPVPNVAAIPDVSAECSVTSLIAPTATDNCAGTIIGTHNATLPITTQGTTLVTWTYDDGNGNISIQTQFVDINDVTPPVANDANLSDITSECSVANLTAPTATDNCSGTITGTHNASLPITTQGTTVVTWTYNDGNGNTSTQTQNVVIDDVTAPVPNIASLLTVNAECSVTVLTAPTATDNCAGTITGTHNITLPISTQGITIVTWTYDDGNGNTSTQTQNVVIDDVTAPVPTVASLSNVNAECSVTSLTAPSATDNCAGTITGTHNATLPITNQGTTVVTWSYDDGNGNTSTQTQNVIITPIDVTTTMIPNASDYTITANASGYLYQWIEDCDTNAPINGETSQSFTPTTNGMYAVIIDNGTCSNISECIIIDDLGMENLNSINIQVYPNPSKKSVTISSNTAFAKIEIENLFGQNLGSYVFEGTTLFSLILPEENGTYLLKISNMKTTVIKRVIKNN